MRRILACLLALSLAGCSSWHYTVNAPLERYDPAYGYRFTSTASPENSDSLFIVVTFSGGGLRAAAMAYAVLERLAAEPIRWNGRSTRLLDEVDLINAVSGGSVTAAYYALHGERIFRDFEPRLFHRDLQDRLESRILGAGSIPRLLSPRYGRIDMVQEFLDEVLFEGKTFAELSAQRRRPYVIISASDMSLGSRFEFTQPFFDLLCSDLDKLPIARAVAASSAMPLVFSPVTLWNYAGTCGLPPRVQPARAQGAMAARQAQREREIDSYLDRERRPYIHLLDGALADNIGIRAILESAALFGGLDRAFEALGLGAMQKLVLIVVNAETDGDRSIDLNADVPTIGQVVRALVDVPINRYSYETQVFGRQSAEEWRRRRSESGAAPLDMYLIDVSLGAVRDPAERQFLMSVPSTLQLPRESTDRVRRAASRLLDDSPDFRRLLESLRAP